MKFKRNAPVILIGSITIVIVLMAVISNRLFSGLTESVEKSQFELMRSILDSSVQSAESRAMARAEMIVSLPTMIEIFAARDRERLLAEYETMFKVQKEKYGVDQAQFHVPPATSFLRLQAPDTFGDDLTKFRPIVVAVNRDQLPRSGLAIARTGPAIFGVVPVFDKNKAHIGSFEIGIDFGSVIDNIKSTYGLELALFIEEQPLRDFAKGVSSDVLSEQNRVGKFIKFHSTHWTLMKELARAGDIATLQEATQYSRNALGQPYGVLLIPLRNGAGQPLGILAAAKDFSGSRSASARSLVWQTSLALFAIILLSGVVIAVLRGFFLRPLAIIGKHYEALVMGDRSKSVEDIDSYCEELQVLALQHERLRIQAEQIQTLLETKEEESKERVGHGS